MRFVFVTTVFAALALSVLADPPSSSSNQPPTTPARPDVPPSLPAEACLAPPSAQRRNQQAARSCVYVNPCARTGYGAEEVAARRLGARAAAEGEWPEWDGGVFMDLDSVLRDLRNQPHILTEDDLVMEQGRIVTDANYQDFLAGLDGHQAPRINAPGTVAGSLLPGSSLPFLAAGLLYLIATMRSGNRRREEPEGKVRDLLRQQ